jgi:excisionase family DNA binding protein
MSRSKFTEENRSAILRYLEAGNTVETACRMVGIHRSQIYRWLKRGEDARAGTTYRTFYDDVQASEARAEVRAMTIVQRGMPDDPKLAVWYLERRRPEQWGRRASVEHTQAGPLVIELKWSGGASASRLADSEVTVLPIPDGA